MKQHYIRPEAFSVTLAQNLMLSFSTSSNTGITPGEARTPCNNTSGEDVEGNWE